VGDHDGGAREDGELGGAVDEDRGEAEADASFWADAEGAEVTRELADAASEGCVEHAHHIEDALDADERADVEHPAVGMAQLIEVDLLLITPQGPRPRVGHRRRGIHRARRMIVQHRGLFSSVVGSRVGILILQRDYVDDWGGRVLRQSITM
jgi:hypothetical protein